MQPESATPGLPAPRKSGLFHGWYIVGSAFLANVAFSEQFSPSYGLLYDFSGSYAASFALMAIACVLAAGLIHMVRAPKAHAY